MTVAKRDFHSMTFYNPEKTYNGFTLFSPITQVPGNTWLIDMRGRFVHRWQLPGWIRMHAELLPTGNLLLALYDPKSAIPGLSWVGGEVIEMDWDGNIVWRYREPYMDTHDRVRMKNGNTLIMKFSELPKGIAARMKTGRPGTELKGGIMLSNVLQEITPEGNVAWEWRAWEHLDPEVVTNSHEVPRAMWPSFNSLVELPDGNILTCSPFTSNLFIIDKATGNIKWMWGQATEKEEKYRISFSHNPSLLDNGNILLFDNGRYGFWRQGHSRIIEVNPTTKEIEWEYEEDNPIDFFSHIQGGCQRLPNGNTLICESMRGRFFEVTQKGEIVWEYISPIYNRVPTHLPSTMYGLSNGVFRCQRYGPDFPGLQGRKFNPEKLDLWNRLYGPDAFRPWANPTWNPPTEKALIEEEGVPKEKEAGCVTASHATYDQSKPSVGQPSKQMSRIKLLGY